MLNYAEKKEISNVSLTGIRAIILLQLLLEAPRTMSEIKDIFVELGILEPKSSDYILRLDMASLKAVGCEISKATKSNNYKYVLEKHPFSLNITEEEINIISKLYKKIKEKSDIELLLSFDSLFKKLSEQICDKEIREKLLGISIFKHYDTFFVRDILLDCMQKRTLNLVYTTPSRKSENTLEIVAQELVLKNDKFYLYGYNLGIKKSIVLNLKRIVKVLSRKLKKDDVKSAKYCVKFRLKNISPELLDKNEKVIETLPDGFVAEGFYHNNFIAAQRMLSFTTNCTVLEPEDFKAEIISKLENMRRLYGI